MTSSATDSAGYAELMSRLRLRVASPDGSVTVAAEAGSAAVVQLSKTGLQRHSATSLSVQVSAAVEGALAGFARAQELALRKAHGDDVSPRSPLRGDLERDCDRIDAMGRSQDELVRITRRGEDGAIRTDINPRALREATPEALGDSITQALADLSRNHRLARAQIYLQSLRRFGAARMQALTSRQKGVAT